MRREAKDKDALYRCTKCQFDICVDCYEEWGSGQGKQTGVNGGISAGQSMNNGDEDEGEDDDIGHNEAPDEFVSDEYTTSDNDV